MGFLKYLEWKVRTEDRLSKYYMQKTNLRLKYAAYISIGICMILLLAGIFLMDKIDWTAYLLIRGFAGLSGILFVLLVGVLVYRVNAAYYKDRDKSPFNE